MAETHYISQDGLEKLKKELAHRKGDMRRDISDKIGIAKEQGDLSENFEYSNAKELQAMNETRIIELEEMIKDAIVVEAKSGGSTISMGTPFTVKLSDGSKKVFTIVGSTETDPMAGKISNESPIGRAFLGKGVGDVMEMKTPSGAVSYEIVSID